VSANTSYLKCLDNELDYLIRQLADKFNLFYNGKPRKAFILDALLRHGCIGYSRVDQVYA